MLNLFDSNGQRISSINYDNNKALKVSKLEYCQIERKPAPNLIRFKYIQAVPPFFT